MLENRRWLYNLLIIDARKKVVCIRSVACSLIKVSNEIFRSDSEPERDYVVFIELEFADPLQGRELSDASWGSIRCTVID
jgi:hypothetical protein